MLALYVIGTIAGGILLAELALHPARRMMTAGKRARASELLLKDGARLEDVTVTAADGTKLSAWFVPSGRSSGTAIILLHGVSDSRLGMYGYAQPLLAQGYDVLLPDARAHGSSEGRIATYGYLERGDIARWSDWLRSSKHETCVDGFGESMGAGQVLQAVGDAHLCAAVAESPFSDFETVAEDRIGYYLHFGGPALGHTLLKPLVEVSLLYVRLRYGLPMRAVSPERSLRESRVPVLLIHGEADVNILPYHSERLHAADPEHSILWLVPAAAHTGAVSVAPEEFWERVLTCLRSAGPSSEAAPR